MRTRELVAAGVELSKARERALARMGDVAAWRRTCLNLGRKRDREMRLTQWLEDLGDDVAFAIRQLKNAPTFAAAAILTLALGIGVNSAIFAIADAILLRPLPYGDPDRLVAVWETSATIPRGRAALRNAVDWKDRGQTLEAVAGLVEGTGGGMVMAGADGRSETIPRQWVSVGFFDVLGVKPIAGRMFLPSDDGPAPNVVVMSEGWWRTRFNSDPTVIGRQIRFDGIPMTVVGIAPREFQFLGPRGIWAAVGTPTNPVTRRNRNLVAIARMKPGASLEATRTDLASVAGALAQEYPESNRGRGVLVEPLRRAVIDEELQLTSMLVLGVVGLLLLMCCANVANLLLTRATSRARELAIRSAVGAGRRRIVRQLLTESLVLAVCGGVVGLAIGAAMLRVAPTLIPPDLLPGELVLSFDARVVLFCTLASLVVGVLFGLAPAWQATGLAAARALGAGGRAITGRGAAIRRGLVVAQVAAAVLTLVAGGLLIRTLLALDRIERGYRADNVLTMMVDPLGSSYPTRPALEQFFASIEQGALALPGVRSVAWASARPMSPSNIGTVTFQAAGEAVASEGQRPVAQLQAVSANYFATLDLPLLAGRTFTSADLADSPRVCIVDEAFARRLGGRSPIGLTIELRPTNAPTATPTLREIVGVARQVRQPDGTEDAINVYLPQPQYPLDDMFLLARVEGGQADRLVSPIRGVIAEIDRQQLVSIRDIATLESVAWEHGARHRFRARTMMLFAGLALLLAMVGVFGVMAHSVQQRAREFSVRMAIGATARDVLRLVFSSAATVVAAGAIVGLGLAASSGRLLASMLFGVEPLDGLTFAAVTGVIVLTAAIAAAAPAWRAARTDPAIALRVE